MLQQRVENLVKAMPSGTQAMLVLTPVNRFYFLDFDSHDAGTLLILPHKMVFIIDSRYIEVAIEKVKHAQVMLEEDALTQLQSILKAEGVTELYVEEEITVKTLSILRNKLQNVNLISDNTLSKNILTLRSIKQPEEIERMRKAQQITDKAFAHILSFIKEGMREVDVMLELEHFTRSNGADGMAFETICVAGANSSRPHGVPGQYRIQNGDFITMDFGAKYMGYCSDMTRTVAIGRVSDEQRKVYDVVLQAHLAGIQAAKPGLEGRQVDAVARDIIYNAGYKGYFGHGLGHAVGIEIHEDPRFSPKNSQIIKPGMMMTVEPGCYLPGRFGCRIEDMVLITEDGCEPLPQSPKELLVL